MGKGKKKKTTTGKFVKEFSAGGVVYRKRKTENSKLKTLWLVTRSTPSKLYPKSIWRLPKGWLDDKDKGKKPGNLALGKIKATDEQIKTAAIREVEEEAGVKAKIIEKIGSERYFLTLNGKRILKFVTFYLMEWLEDNKEGFSFETCEVKWLSYEEAKKLLSYGSEKKILDKGREILESRIQETLV